jgi:hypothetical protein
MMMNDDGARHPAVPLRFGGPGGSLFGWYHPPRGALARAAGIVLCNPLGDDDVRAHRPLRHLAERLSAAGFGAPGEAWVRRTSCS